MKPPQYEEMDGGRELAIPRAFRMFCESSGNYRLVTIPPEQHPPGWCGPLPRNTYEVRRADSDELMAEFYPNGNYNNYSKDFEPTFRQMVDIIELSGQEAYRRFMDEYERRRQC